MLENKLYSVAVAAGLPSALASLLTAQARHESNNFKSNVFKTDNNLFGYKYVGQKNATRGLKSPEGDYYAHYKSPDISIIELVGWLKRREKSGVFPALSTITDPGQYATLLKKANYYGDSVNTYTAGLKRYFKNYGVVSFAGLFVIAAALYFMSK
jgi:flagellum-specific peptidoglycan hydrolase FlgJ